MKHQLGNYGFDLHQLSWRCTLQWSSRRIIKKGLYFLSFFLNIAYVSCLRALLEGKVLRAALFALEVEANLDDKQCTYRGGFAMVLYARLHLSALNYEFKRRFLTFNIKQWSIWNFGSRSEILLEECFISKCECIMLCTVCHKGPDLLWPASQVRWRLPKLAC